MCGIVCWCGLANKTTSDLVSAEKKVRVVIESPGEKATKVNQLYIESKAQNWFVESWLKIWLKTLSEIKILEKIHNRIKRQRLRAAGWHRACQNNIQNTITTSTTRKRDDGIKISIAR